MVDLEAAITLELIATGVMSPHEGLMVEEEYLSSLETGRLTNGLPWPVPLSFAPTGTRNEEVVANLSVGEEVALIDSDGLVRSEERRVGKEWRKGGWRKEQKERTA